MNGTTNDTPKVSVLVPVYNMAAYLPQCMKALCNQTLEDLEIIAIDDGSTDASPEILRYWADKDARIRIISKPNSGYGASMNRGLEAARGTYVGIVEPDDFPDLVMFQKLVRVAEKHNADVVKCNYYLHYADHEDVAWNFHGFGYNVPFDPADNPAIVTTPPAIWTGLYRRSFLRREQIDFRETPGASFQDAAFSLKVWFAATRAVLLRRPMLHYRMDNPGSSSKTTDKVYTVCDELACAYEFLQKRPDRARAFAPWFNVDKWGKYRWNYERIAPAVHVEFAERMRDEFEAAREAGELDINLFERNSKGQLLYLLDKGPEAFAKRYPDSFPLDYEDDPLASDYVAECVARGSVAPATKVPSKASGAQQQVDAVVPEGPSPAVSVIVPVYNTAPFVTQCLDSLKAQTYGDFEVFVVDDASTDDSLAIVNAAVEGDDRFTVLPQPENRGLSAVRNVGLAHASGEYVVFLDSDDYLRADALAKLVTRARTQRLDDLYFSGESFYETDDVRDTLVEDFGVRTSFEGVLTGRELFVYFEERDQFFTQAALRMVRRGLLEEHGIRFKEGILHEDILFTFQTLVVSERSSFLNEPLYQRRLRADSIMGRKRTLANIEGHFVSLQAMKKWFYEHADEVDSPFAAALAKRIATWREMVAHDWSTDISSEDQARYLAELSPTDRVDFYCDIIGSGAGAARVRQEYSASRAYQLGRALVAGPRFLLDRVSDLASKLGVNL